MHAIVGRRVQLRLRLTKQRLGLGCVAAEVFMARATLRLDAIDRVIDHVLFRVEPTETTHLLRHGRDSGKRDACENNASYHTFHFDFLSNLKDTFLTDDMRRMKSIASNNAPLWTALTHLPREGVSANYEMSGTRKPRA
ncbi:hypothetical protein [Burkholderia sp. THE68]|uniref:hypothetical protein n=1 Tax=Burkholderia sp. THE68 TaxID=758782 RepID=UPI00138A005F|nr:hypothetical protein [Burkholderia sp. THE68]